MSSSLDKLKALTSKLEEKLEQKRRGPMGDLAPLSELAQVAAATAAVQPVAEERRAVAAPVTEKQQVAHRSVPFEIIRQENIKRVKTLYEKLGINEKAPDFDNIFVYKAMNLSGIGLKEEDFGQIREGKYVQIIAIIYEPDKNGKKKAKNISLGYFGKAENLSPEHKSEIIEFVLRWRYEKAFQNVEHYRELIAKIDQLQDTLF